MLAQCDDASPLRKALNPPRQQGARRLCRGSSKAKLQKEYPSAACFSLHPGYLSNMRYAPLAFAFGFFLTASITSFAAAPATQPACEVFIQGSGRPKIQPAEKANRLKDGMTLRDVVKQIGPGWISPASCAGRPQWFFDDGRILSMGFSMDPSEIVDFKKDSDSANSAGGGGGFGGSAGKTKHMVWLQRRQAPTTQESITPDDSSDSPSQP